MKTTGRVVEVFSRPWEGRNGTINLKSFKLEGDSKFYRTGENDLCKVNDLVEFDYDAKGNVGALEVTGTATTPPPAQQQVQKQGFSRGYSGGGGGGGGFKQKQAEKDQYWADKEQYQKEVVEPRITWASAQSDAVVVVNAALQHDLLAFGNANKSAKLGLLLEYVDQVTARFAAQRYNAAALLKDVIANQEQEVKAAKAEAASDLG
jgi:hypothetical protein